MNEWQFDDSGFLGQKRVRLQQESEYIVLPQSQLTRQQHIDTSKEMASILVSTA